MRLPTGYVVEHVDLAYARTDVAEPGSTIYGGVMFLGRATDVATSR